MMIQKIKMFSLGLTMVLVSLACGQVSVGVEVDNDSAGNSQGEVENGSIDQPSPEPETGSEQYWVVVEDPNHGFRFAVPCFWVVEFPTAAVFQDPAMASYQLYNYTQEYAMSFPRSVIPEENGAIKVDFNPIHLPSNGLPNEISLADYIAQENAGGDSEVLAVDEVTLNQTPAVVATIHYGESDSTGRYYLLRLSEEYLLRISVYWSSKLFDTLDLQGILNSITFDPQAAVPLPRHTPDAPPVGLAAPCIPEYAEAVVPAVEIPEGNTACGLSSFESLEFLTGKVTDYLQSRNTGGLRWEYLFTDPFVFKAWGGETQSVSGEQFATMLANQLYDATGEMVMSFTSDRAQFPPLGGSPAESLLGPGVAFVQVIYSQGWGLDGQGAALLYFAQDDCGGYYWYGIVFDDGHFDE